jgi:hypothetical protein
VPSSRRRQTDLAFGTRGEIITASSQTTLGYIKPVFRTKDRDSMMAAFDVFDYEDGASGGDLREHGSHDARGARWWGPVRISFGRAMGSGRVVRL